MVGPADLGRSVLCTPEQERAARNSAERRRDVVAELEIFVRGLGLNAEIRAHGDEQDRASSWSSLKCPLVPRHQPACPHGELRIACGERPRAHERWRCGLDQDLFAEHLAWACLDDLRGLFAGRASRGAFAAGRLRGRWRVLLVVTRPAPLPPLSSLTPMSKPCSTADPGRG